MLVSEIATTAYCWVIFDSSFISLARCERKMLQYVWFKVYIEVCSPLFTAHFSQLVYWGKDLVSSGRVLIGNDSLCDFLLFFSGLSLSCDQPSVILRLPLMFLTKRTAWDGTWPIALRVWSSFKFQRLSSLDFYQAACSYGLILLIIKIKKIIWLIDYYYGITCVEQFFFQILSFFMIVRTFGNLMQWNTAF